MKRSRGGLTDFIVERVLLTNDDGIDAQGIRVLEEGSGGDSPRGLGSSPRTRSERCFSFDQVSSSAKSLNEIPAQVRRIWNARRLRCHRRAGTHEGQRAGSDPVGNPIAVPISA